MNNDNGFKSVKITYAKTEKEAKEKAEKMREKHPNVRIRTEWDQNGNIKGYEITGTNIEEHLKVEKTDRGEER